MENALLFSAVLQWVGLVMLSEWPRRLVVATAQLEEPVWSHVLPPKVHDFAFSRVESQQSLATPLHQSNHVAA